LGDNRGGHAAADRVPLCSDFWVMTGPPCVDRLCTQIRMASELLTLITG